MIDAGRQGRATSIEVQAAQYEGFTVWINALIAGAGGQIVDEDGNVKVDESADAGGRDHQAGWPPRAAPPGHGQQQGGPGADRLRVRALRLPDQLLLHLPERRREQGRGVPEEDRLGALPAHRERTSRAARRSAASTSAWAPTRRTRTWPSRPPTAWPSPSNQVIASEKGGLPPTTESRVRRPEGRRRPTVRRPAARVDRGRRAAAGEPRLQRHLAGDPEDLPPARQRRARTRSWTSSRTGWTRRPRGRSSDGRRPSPPAAGTGRARRSAQRPRALRAPAGVDAVRARR